MAPRPRAVLGLLRPCFQTLDGKEPNGAHLALVELEERGVLNAVVTQNIDRLHRVAGTRELVEVHGTIATSSCLDCGSSADLAEVRRRVAAAPDGVPRCEDCAAPLKPDVVLFGEWLPVDAIERAQALCAGADVLLCIGTRSRSIRSPGCRSSPTRRAATSCS